jgi:hypothetical protein
MQAVEKYTEYKQCIDIEISKGQDRSIHLELDGDQRYSARVWLHIKPNHNVHEYYRVFQGADAINVFRDAVKFILEKTSEDSSAWFIRNHINNSNDWLPPGSEPCITRQEQMDVFKELGLDIAPNKMY